MEEGKGASYLWVLGSRDDSSGEDEEEEEQEEDEEEEEEEEEEEVEEEVEEEPEEEPEEEAEEPEEEEVEEPEEEEAQPEEEIEEEQEEAEEKEDLCCDHTNEGNEYHQEEVNINITNISIHHEYSSASSYESWSSFFSDFSFSDGGTEHKVKRKKKKKKKKEKKDKKEKSATPEGGFEHHMAPMSPYAPTNPAYPGGPYPPTEHMHPMAQFPPTNPGYPIGAHPPAGHMPGMAPYPQPGMAPYPQPGMAPYSQPGMAPYPQPGMAPYPQPGMAPHSQPGMAPYPQPGMAPYPQPGMAPQSQPGMAPYPQPGMAQYPPTDPVTPTPPASGATPESYEAPLDQPTLLPHGDFDPEADAQALRKAMKGFGTDEKAIINILGRRSCGQRLAVMDMYKAGHGRDLVADLKKELGGKFEDAMVALMMKGEERDAGACRRAMAGAGTDEAALIEILCTRTNAQIHALNAAYKTKYEKSLEEAIIDETSGHFQKLLVSLSTGGRQEDQKVDLNKAYEDAQRLYGAGQDRWGTDEGTFNFVLASQSHRQLRAVFDAYMQISQHDIEDAIKDEMSGDTADGMLAIVRSIRNKHAYFAERLYKSMKGLGTDDSTLIRVVVSRCEVDMASIKAEFMHKYGTDLIDFIKDDCSGDYKRLLVALVTG